MGLCQENDINSKEVEEFNEQILDDTLSLNKGSNLFLPQTFFDSPTGSIFENLFSTGSNIEPLTRLPTDIQYEKCKNNNGLSVWDTSGLWNCLFPKSNFTGIRSNKLDPLAPIEAGFGFNEKDLNYPSKEDVIEDKNHKLGLFFPEFNGYLSWRLHMKELQKKKLQEKRTLFENVQRERSIQNNPLSINTPEEIHVYESLNDIADKNVIGTSRSVSMKSSPQGKQKVSLHKTYYDDGTVKIRTETETTPHDRKIPTKDVKEETVLVEDDNSHDI